MIAAFGSYFCGGHVLEASGRPLRMVDVTAHVRLSVDENGSHAVGHAYVQWFRPVARNALPPVVLLHGGGLSGSVWEATPDGRPGWVQRLLHHGFEVHVVDNVERGRAGWSPLMTPEPPVVRTLQDAWTLFRLGRAEDFAGRRPFPGQQFPVGHLETLGRFGVPRWTSQGAAQTEAFAHVLARLGRAVVICHSQGAEAAFGAAHRAPDRVAAMVAIEPSGFPPEGSPALGLPLLLVQGDYLDTAPIWQEAQRRWEALLDAARRRGADAGRLDLTMLAPGSSHMPMHDGNSDAVLDAIAERLASGLVPAR